MPCYWPGEKLRKKKMNSQISSIKRLKNVFYHDFTAIHVLVTLCQIADRGPVTVYRLWIQLQPPFDPICLLPLYHVFTRSRLIVQKRFSMSNKLSMTLAHLYSDFHVPESTTCPRVVDLQVWGCKDLFDTFRSEQHGKHFADDIF